MKNRKPVDLQDFISASRPATGKKKGRLSPTENPEGRWRNFFEVIMARDKTSFGYYLAGR